MHAAAVSLADINQMTESEFVSAFGDVAEHSPWVASAAAKGLPFGSHEDLVQAFEVSLDGAEKTDQLAVIRAHPDLAGKAAKAGALSADSTSEQKGAGLDSLTDDEYARFQNLNGRYKDKFGFPFILAVKGATKYIIFEAFEARINNSEDVEFHEALTQIKKIMRFRLEDRVCD